MKNVKKMGLFLITIILVNVLPISVAVAQGATVGVNNGDGVSLNVSQSIPATSTSGIPVMVKDLPNLGAGKGLAAFELSFSWNPGVIRVDSVSVAAAAIAEDWTILSGTANNTSGTLKVAGFRTTYTTNNVTLVYLGITAVGRAGDATALSAAINVLIDNDFKNIPATAVSAPVSIRAAPAGGGGGTPTRRLVSIGIAPVDPSIPVGYIQQFIATGNHSDASAADITGSVAWTSGDGTVVTIQTAGDANPGLAMALAAGTTTITASLDTVSATTTITVTKPGEKPPAEEEQPAETPPPTTPVKEAATGTPPAEKETAATPPSEPTSPAESPPPLSSTGTGANWWVTGGIAAGAVTLAVGVFFLLKKLAVF